MSEPLFRIIYCSRNTMGADADPAELDQILTISRRNNAKLGVTGALVYNDGIFAQVLEGPFEAVQTVFERIQTDTRHDGVVVLEAQSAAHRLFGAWSMAHAEPHDFAAARETLSRAMLDHDATAAAALLDVMNSVLRYEPV